MTFDISTAREAIPKENIKLTAGEGITHALMRLADTENKSKTMEEIKDAYRALTEEQKKAIQDLAKEVMKSMGITDAKKIGVGTVVKLIPGKSAPTAQVDSTGGGVVLPPSTPVEANNSNSSTSAKVDKTLAQKALVGVGTVVNAVVPAANAATIPAGTIVSTEKQEKVKENISKNDIEKTISAWKEVIEQGTGISKASTIEDLRISIDSISAKLISQLVKYSTVHTAPADIEWVKSIYNKIALYTRGVDAGITNKHFRNPILAENLLKGVLAVHGSAPKLPERTSLLAALPESTKTKIVILIDTEMKKNNVPYDIALGKVLGNATIKGAWEKVYDDGLGTYEKEMNTYIQKIGQIKGKTTEENAAYMQLRDMHGMGGMWNFKDKTAANMVLIRDQLLGVGIGVAAGVALSATGIGAVVGVPLVAAAVVGGLTMTGANMLLSGKVDTLGDFSKEAGINIATFGAGGLLLKAGRIIQAVGGVGIGTGSDYARTLGTGVDFDFLTSLKYNLPWALLPLAGGAYTRLKGVILANRQALANRTAANIEKAATQKALGDIQGAGTTMKNIADDILVTQIAQVESKLGVPLTPEQKRALTVYLNVDSAVHTPNGTRGILKGTDNANPIFSADQRKIIFAEDFAGTVSSAPVVPASVPTPAVLSTPTTPAPIVLPASSVPTASLSAQRGFINLPSASAPLSVESSISRLLSGPHQIGKSIDIGGGYSVVLESRATKTGLFPTMNPMGKKYNIQKDGHVVEINKAKQEHLSLSQVEKTLAKQIKDDITTNTLNREKYYADVAKESTSKWRTGRTEEITHNGEVYTIVKNKKTGDIDMLDARGTTVPAGQQAAIYEAGAQKILQKGMTEWLNIYGNTKISAIDLNNSIKAVHSDMSNMNLTKWVTGGVRIGSSISAQALDRIRSMTWNEILTPKTIIEQSIKAVKMESLGGKVNGLAKAIVLRDSSVNWKSLHTAGEAVRAVVVTGAVPAIGMAIGSTGLISATALVSVPTYIYAKDSISGNSYMLSALVNHLAGSVPGYILGHMLPDSDEEKKKKSVKTPA